MRQNYTLPRLYTETALNEGAEIDLPKEQAHYLGTVLRKLAGDDLRVFNRESGEWRAEILQVSRKGGRLIIREQLRPPAKMPDIWLCFAPVRKHRNAFIIEKGTELGVAAFRPILTEHTQFSRFNADKARLQAIEASEQTERLDVPKIHVVMEGGLEAMLKDWPQERRLIFADEAGDAAPALSVLKDMEDGPTALLIGPEGGFSSREQEVVRAQSFVSPVSLGPRILRADTAALSLLTLWQAARGDWTV